MQRLRAAFDGNTLIAIFLALGVGGLLWHSRFQDVRSDAQKAAETRWDRLRRPFWPPDGQPGWGSPIPGSLGGAWRFKSYDWLFLLRHRLNPPPVPPDILILSMEEQSHVVLDQPINAPWDRSIHARVLERCLTNGARAVVFDIVFGDMKLWRNPQADQVLADAMRLGSNRVVIAYATTPSRQKNSLVPNVIAPPGVLREALVTPARASVVENRYYAGLPDLEPDYDQRVRRLGPSYPPYKHSLAWSLAGLLDLPCLTAARSTNRAPESEERWLNYYGPSGHLDSIKYHQVLTNLGGGPPVPGIVFSNRVIFIGAGTLTKFSGERKDSYISPFGALGEESERFVAGVEIQATAALNLIRNDWMTRMNLRWELGLILLVGCGCGLVFPRLDALSMTAAAAGAGMAVTGVAYGLFLRQHLWFGWLIPLTQIFVTWLVALVSNSARLFVQNRIYQNQLGLYLSPKLVKKFAQDKDQRFTKPGAIKTELTIFFSDIAGFTSVSEGLDSDELARTMNRYFQDSVGNCIFPTDGTVVKYIGDAIFAFWNAPDPQSDHARRACDAALRFRKQTIIEVNGKPLITRIGLHTGVANVGNFGSTQRMDYTAIGENINLASRMEGLNKYVGTETLVTEATYVLVADQFLFRPLGKFILKGFERAIGVYELCATPDRAPEFAELHAHFADALNLFIEGRLDSAKSAFLAVQQRWPKDGPTQLYLKTIEELASHPPEARWTGAIELKEK